MNDRPLTVLYLTRYERRGASSRYRFFQFFPALEAAGIRCVASPLLDDGYLARRYADGGGSLGDFARALCRRLAVLLTVRRYQLVFVEKELIPYFPALPERLLALFGVRYLAEYDDALFHQYDRHRALPVRLLLGEKIAAVMRHSCMVIAGNAYLADYARKSGAPRVEILPTVIELERYPLAPPPENEVFTIGWIGSPSTSAYLADIAPALARVCRGGRARVVLIGAGDVELPGVPAAVVPWSEEDEVARMGAFDVGIMPLPETPWALGKCGFKIIQYMACGVPVVASAVGANLDIVDEGENGFLVSTTEQWVARLTALLGDRELRAKMGKRGRDKVEREYCTAVVAPKLVRLIRESAVAG